LKGGFAIDLVRDKKLRMKHQLYVAGVTPFQYWATQLMVYLLLFALPLTVAIILPFACKVTALTGESNR
jgi:hypothetical protein